MILMVRKRCSTIRALCMLVAAATVSTSLLCDGFVMPKQQRQGQQRQSASFTPKRRMNVVNTFHANGDTECNSVTMDKQQQQHSTEIDKVWKYLLDRFQGDFDNYNQVVQDRTDGLLPREGGGHENFHCTLIPVSDKGRLAAFYFDGNPQRIFRFRYYELAVPKRDGESNAIEMRLYTLNPKLEGILRSNSESPMEWPTIFENFHADEDDSEEKFVYLPNCEITWSLNIDPEQHEYTVLSGEKDDTSGIHAVMVHGEAIVDSTIIPGVKIRIIDQLSLYENVFYINDRGLDPESGEFIYGNHRGVPYRMERVATLNDGERVVSNEELRWTMGEQWRTTEEYEAKLKAAGGPSVGMKRPSPQSKS